MSGSAPRTRLMGHSAARSLPPVTASVTITRNSISVPAAVVGLCALRPSASALLQIALLSSEHSTVSTGPISMVLCRLIAPPRSAQAQGRGVSRLPLRPHADRTATDAADGKTVSLTVDAGKMKAVHPRQHVRLRGLPQGRQVLAAREDARQDRLRPVPRRRAGRLRAQLPRHRAQARRLRSTPATCTDCHGDAHTILPASDPKSPVYHSNIPATCGACHGQKFLMESTGNSAQPFVSYQESVHGRAVENGSQTAAVCTDCHGAHDILPANDAKSLINKFNVPATCGKCHAGVQTVFTQSIHGQAIARGNGWRRSAPTATASTPSRRPPIPTPRSPPEPLARHLRRLPSGRAPHPGVRRHRQPRLHLQRQLPRPRLAGRLGGGRQLLQLPRRPQHSAVQRSALHHQSRQPRRHLRPVPQGSHAEVHPNKVHVDTDGGPPTRARSRCAGCAGSIFRSSCWSSAACSCTTQSCGAPSHRPPPRAGAHRRPHDAQSALAAPHPAHQLLRPGGHRLRAQVSGLMVRRAPRPQRALAQHHPSHRRSPADRRRHLPHLLCRLHRDGRRLIRDLFPT
jgi:hypothetical protein